MIQRSMRVQQAGTRQSAVWVSLKGRIKRTRLSTRGRESALVPTATPTPPVTAPRLQTVCCTAEPIATDCSTGALRDRNAARRTHRLCPRAGQPTRPPLGARPAGLRPRERAGRAVVGPCDPQNGLDERIRADSTLQRRARRPGRAPSVPYAPYVSRRCTGRVRDVPRGHARGPRRATQPSCSLTRGSSGPRPPERADGRIEPR